jgi:hypothetical protein
MAAARYIARVDIPRFSWLQAFLGLLLAGFFCLVATKGMGASLWWWLAVPAAAVGTGFYWKNSDWHPSELFGGDSDWSIFGGDGDSDGD